MGYQVIVTYMCKVKHAGNEPNTEKTCGEQYLCMGICPRWPVMCRERILHAWGVAVTLCCAWKSWGLHAMSQHDFVSVIGHNTLHNWSL